MKPTKVTVYRGKDVVKKFYLMNVEHWSYTELQKKIKSNINTELFDVFWIDTDNDEIAVNNYDDLQIFNDLADSSPNGHGNLIVKLKSETGEAPSKKVAFTEPLQASAPKPPTAKTDEKDSLPMHGNVVCDACDSGIRGFRYKCLQCADYDLCMDCEHKMNHKDHLMVRIPAASLDRLPKIVDRVLNIGQLFERKEAKQWRKEEDKWRREQEKWRRFEEKQQRREDKQERRRCHRGPPPPPPSAPNTTETPNERNMGFFYHAMDFLNYMMNPDNIMPNGPLTPTTTPTVSNTDKGQEAQEKTQEAPEQPRSFMEPANVPTAVALGTDANIMTTSVGVAAHEEPIAAQKVAEKVEPTAPPATEEKTLAEQINEKLENMEKNLRSRSPTISVASHDSDGSKDGDKEWTVLDNEEEDGAVGGGAETEVKKQDKSTLTDSETSTPSSYKSTEKKTEPLSFEQLGRDLKKHIEESAGVLPKTPYPHPQPIFHPMPHINNAIETMMGMGFSNEGGWLTGLLASVDGNIPKALDLLQPK